MSTPSNKSLFFSAAGAALTLGVLVLLRDRMDLGQGTGLLLASMGASAVLVFGAPLGPFSGPWAVVGGHCVSALVGVFCASWIPQEALAGGCAVGGALAAMRALRCTHPPGGATALFAVIGGGTIRALGFSYVVTPVLWNALALTLVGILYNRFTGTVPSPARGSQTA